MFVSFDDDLSGHAFFLKERPDFDHLLNIFGLAGLVAGSFLIARDWLWVILKSDNHMMPGVTHFEIDIWAIAPTAFGLQQ